MGHSYDGAERRKYVRIPKSFSLSFYIKNVTERKLDESITKDISRGGLRFTSSHSLKQGAHLVLEIGIPYIAPKKLSLEAFVVACKEITLGMVYEIRVQFITVDDQALQLFDLIEKRHTKDSKTYGLH